MEIMRCHCNCADNQRLYMLCLQMDDSLLVLYRPGHRDKMADKILMDLHC